MIKIAALSLIATGTVLLSFALTEPKKDKLINAIAFGAIALVCLGCVVLGRTI